jgi:hypothetical protein
MQKEKHYVFTGQTTAFGFKGSYNAEKKAKELWAKGQDAVFVLQMPNFYLISNGVNLNQQVYSFDEVSKLMVGEFSHD